MIMTPDVSTPSLLKDMVVYHPEPKFWMRRIFSRRVKSLVNTLPVYTMPTDRGSFTRVLAFENTEQPSPQVNHLLLLGQHISI